MYLIISNWVKKKINIIAMTVQLNLFLFPENQKF